MHVDLGEIILAIVEEEAIVGAGVLEEVLQRSLEADLLHDRAHLAMDPRHFAQADVVDLVGSEIGRRVIGEQRLVIFRAIVEAPDTVIGRRDRLLALHFGEQALISGAGRSRPSGLRGSFQLGLARFGNLERGNLAGEILEHGVLVTCLKQVLDVVDHIGIDPVGRHHAIVGAGSGFGGQRIDCSAKTVDARDIGFRVGLCTHPVDVDQERRKLALRAEHLVEDEAVAAKLVTACAALGHGIEEAITQRIFFRQRGKIEFGAHAVGGRLEQRFAAHLCRVGHVVPARIVFVTDPAVGLAHRRECQALRVVVIEQCSQSSVLARSFGCRSAGDVFAARCRRTGSQCQNGGR